MTRSHQSTESVEVLLVEENPADVRLFEEQFRETDLRGVIHTASRAAEAEEFLARRAEADGESPPDVVLVGANREADAVGDLGDSTGADRVPVVLLTASDAETALLRSNGADADDYLTKPPAPGDVLAVARSFDGA